MEYEQPIGEQPLFDEEAIEELRAYMIGLQGFSFSDAQSEIDTWERSVFEPHELTPHRTIVKAEEEVEELKDPVIEFMNGNHGYERFLVEEATDVIIAMIGIINAFGGDTGQLVRDKIEVMKQKYHPEKIQELKANGHDTHSAIAESKNTWNMLYSL